MMLFVRGAALAGLLVALLAAPAFGWHRRTASYYYSGYYAPVAGGVSYYQFVPNYNLQPAVVWVPCAPGTAGATLPTRVSIYAPPTPAPPSQTVEPPLGKPDQSPGPPISEWRAGSATPAAKGRYAVGFWNVSSRDVLLTVAGQTRLLPRNRSITLELEREFIWQVDQQAARQERVAAERNGMEIVIR